MQAAIYVPQHIPAPGGTSNLSCDLYVGKGKGKGRGGRFHPKKGQTVAQFGK